MVEKYKDYHQRYKRASENLRRWKWCVELKSLTTLIRVSEAHGSHDICICCVPVFTRL